MVIALSVLSVMLSAIAWQLAAQRRMLERRFDREQAVWLARAGMERALARLVADPRGAAGETVELVPNSRLHVTVRREPGADDIFLVTSESRFPTDDLHPIARTETRRLRRVVEGAIAHIAILEGNKELEEASP